MMIVVTGGGTGGHLYPGIAAAKAILAAGEPVTYVGAAGGIEERVLPQSELPFRIIPAGKLSREALRPNEGIKVLRGLWEAREVLRDLRPKAVLSMGGYAGFPTAFIGSLRGIPTVVHEQNAKLGLANRMLARLARRVTLSTPVELGPVLDARTQVVGYPVREERFDQAEAREQLGLETDRPTILVLGGSQGSKELNDNLPERLYPLLNVWQVLHQCGTRWEAEMRAKERPGYFVRGYLDTALAWSAADFAVTRGGAGTLAEAAYHGVPVLGVPLPAELDGGAQRANVRFYSGQGAAQMLGSWEAFGKVLNDFLDPSLRAEMRGKLAKLSPAGAAKRLATVVLEAV